LVLRNELLFERYLRQQYRRRFGTVQKDLMVTESEQNEKQALYDKIKEQQASISQLQSVVAGFQKEISKVTDKYEKFLKEINEKIKSVNEENQIVKEENRTAKLELEVKDLELGGLKQELDHANKRLFELESHLQDTSAKKLQQEDYKKHFLNIREELLAWQQHQQLNLDKLEKAKEAISLIAHQKEAFTKLNQQLERNLEDNAELKMRVKESEERSSQLSKEVEQTKALLENHKSLLQLQQQASEEKRKAIEDKYITIKQINAGQEKRLFDMEVLLEKTEHLLKLAVSKKEVDTNSNRNSLP